VIHKVTVDMKRWADAGGRKQERARGRAVSEWEKAHQGAGGGSTYIFGREERSEKRIGTTAKEEEKGGERPGAGGTESLLVLLGRYPREQNRLHRNREIHSLLSVHKKRKGGEMFLRSRKLPFDDGLKRSSKLLVRGNR